MGAAEVTQNHWQELLSTRRGKAWVLFVVVTFAFPVIAVMRVSLPWSWTQAAASMRLPVALLVVVALASILSIPCFFIVLRQIREGRPKAGAASLLTIALIYSLSAFCLQFCVTILTDQIKELCGAGEKQVSDSYRNHDLGRLAGRAVRISLLRARERTEDPADRDAITRAADLFPEAWLNAGGNEGPLAGLFDSEGTPDGWLARIVIENNAPAFAPQQWAAFLDRVCEQEKVTLLPEHSRTAASHMLAEWFPFAVREAVKNSWDAGGRAWPALSIDIQRIMFDRLIEAVPPGGAEWLTEVEQLSQNQKSLLRSFDGMDAGVRVARSELGAKLHEQTMQLSLIRAGMLKLQSGVDSVRFEQRESKARDTELLAAVDRIEAALVAASRPIPGPLMSPGSGPDAPHALVRARLTAFTNARLELEMARRSEHSNRWDLTDDWIEMLDGYSELPAVWSTQDEFNRLLIKGDRAAAAYEHDEAVQWYKAALELVPDDPECSIRLISALRECRYGSFRANSTDAMVLCDALLGRDGTLRPDQRVALLLHRASLLCDLGRWRDSVSTLELLLADSASHPIQDPFYRCVALVEMARARHDAGQTTLAGSRIGEALQLAQRHGDSQSVKQLQLLAYAYQDYSDSDGRGLAQLQNRIEHLQGLDEKSHSEYASLLMLAAQAYDTAGMPIKSAVRIEEAIAFLEENFARSHPLLQRCRIALAIHHYELGREGPAWNLIAESTDLLQQELPAGNPSVAIAALHAGQILIFWNATDEAEEIISIGIQMLTDTFGESNIFVARGHALLAKAFLASQDLARAREEAELAAAIVAEIRGPDSQDVFSTSLLDAEVGFFAGDSELALNLTDALVDDAQQRGWSGQARSAMSLRARLLFAAGRFDEAAESYRSIVDDLENRLGPTSELLAQPLFRLMESQHMAQLPAEAVQSGQRGLEIVEQYLGPNNLTLAHPLMMISAAYVNLHMEEEAIESARRALAIYPTHAQDLRPGPWLAHCRKQEAAARSWFARQLREFGRLDEAIAEQRLLVELTRTALEPDAPRVRHYEEVLRGWESER